MAIYEYIEDAIPGWMKLNPYIQWRDLFLTVSLVADAEIDGLYDGRLASFPNQVALPDFGGYESIEALPLIGRDRRISQGPGEPTVSYAARLRAWRQTWKGAGTAKSILGELQAVLSPNPPVLRLVTSSGLWYTVLPDGTYIFETPAGTGFQINPDKTVVPDTNHAYPWDWDSLSGELVVDDPFRIWAIIYAPTNPPLNGTEGSWGDNLSFYAPQSYPGVTVGTTATFSYVELVRSVLNNWKPAGIQLSHVIVAFDSASFNPLAAPLTPGYPDGTWGNAGKIISSGGGQQRVSARNLTARYWRGTA